MSGLLELLKGKKLKILGLAWAAAAIVDGVGGINILQSIDAANWIDNVVFGFGVFAGRDALDTLLAKVSAEMKAK